jgi:hypothetical protein
MGLDYEWKKTNGAKCPGCGQTEWVNQYGHEQWNCGSRWTSNKKTRFLQSDECQRWELDRLHANIKELSDKFDAFLKEIKRQEALKYQPPAGKD